MHGSRVLLFAAILSACSAVQTDPEPLAFEVRRVDVGFESAAVRVDDFDGDTHADIIVAGGGSIRVLRGDGSGGFLPMEAVPAGHQPVDLAVGDFDEDGWLDLAVANHETSYITLLFGAAGGFSAVRRVRLEVSVEPHPHAVVSVDVDRDGHLDLLVDDRAPGRLRIYGGRGDGTFERAADVAVGGDPYRGMTLSDLDRDGDLDVVTPNPSGVAIQRGDGSGSFVPGVELRLGRLRPFTVTVADVNGDGSVDIGAGSGEGGDMFAVWLGTPDRGFIRDPGSPYPIAPGPTTAIAADVNGDGLSDFLVTSYWGDELTVFLGGSPPLTTVRIEVAGRPWGLATGDFNHDGRLDVVTASDASTEIAVLLGRS